MTTKIATTNIQDSALTTLLGPKVTTIVYPGDDTATDTAGGATINLTGNGFQNGCSVLVASTASSVVSFISSTQISFVAPALSAGTYVIYVINPDGGTAISIPGISYSGTPNWTTSAGSLGTAYEEGAISATLTATGDAPITYTLVSGTLPTGSTLNSNGTLSGTAQATASATTYSFTIKATDAQNQDTNRAFSITINPDVVTWTTPTNNETYNVSADAAIANVTMNATSASGGSITYTADTLPTGLSITGANIAGTPTVAASTTTTLTATSTSTRSATRTINWVVSIANEIYFKNVTLLLNGETTVTPFISDASTNSFGLTINGDTKPVLFNPYTPGYYSNYFDGSSYISTPNATNLVLDSSNYTIELWVYPLSSASPLAMISKGSTTSISTEFWSIEFTNTTGGFAFYCGAYNGASSAFLSGTATLNTWTHIAIVRNSLVHTLYVNGISVSTVTAGSSYTVTSAGSLYLGTGSYAPSSRYFTGYISNARIVLGTALYTTGFTPSITPLTSIVNTSLLTCQSNRFIDNSTNAFTFGPSGSPQISSVIPFTQNSSYSTYGSAYFDSTGDNLVTPTGTIGTFGTSPFTIEFWMYSVDAASVLIRQDASGTPNWALIITSGNIYWQNGYEASSLYYLALSSLTTNPLVSAWTHVAITRNSSNQLKFWINGIGQTPYDSDTTDYNTTSAIRIGQGSYGEYSNSYLSDVRITKGTAVYTTAFTPPTSPLTAIANTSLLTLQYNGGANNEGIIDNSNFNNIITRSGNTSQGSFSPYSVTGWSNYFDGTGDYLTVTGIPVPSTGQFTIEAWIYTLESGTQMIYSQYSTSDSNRFTFNIDTSTGYKLSVTHPSGQIFGATVVPLYQWNHVAVTRDASNTLRIFLNGVVDSSTANWTQSIFQVNPRIGYYNNTPLDYFTGYISNLRVVSGTAVYTSAFTPPTSPLTAISGTSLLTCQSNRFIDNSTNNFAITRTGDVSVQAYSPFGSISEATPLSYSNYFDGTGDYLSVANNSAFSLSTGSYTIEFWAYWNSISGEQVLVERFSAPSGPGYTLYKTGSHTISIYGSGTVVTSTTAVTTSTWYHIAISYNGTNTRIFVNGTLEATAATNITDGGTSLIIGSRTGGSAFFNGYMSNLRIVKGTATYTATFTPSTTPLTTTSQGATASQVSLLTCQSTTMIDNSTNAFTITAVGDVKPRIFNPFGYTARSATSYTPSLHGGSAYFDGTGDYLSMSAIGNPLDWPASANYTIEAWVYLNAFTGSESSCILARRNPTATTTDWQFQISTTGALVFYNLNGGTTITASSTMVIKQWNHCAVVITAGTARLYLNGTLVSTPTSVSAASTASISTYIVGASNSVYLNGYISNLRVIKGTAVYTSNFVLPTTSLTSIANSSLLLNFTNGGIIDQHGSNVLETVGNAQLSTAVKKYGSASMYFDGVVGTYLITPISPLYNVGIGDFTVEGWFYFNSLILPTQEMFTFSGATTFNFTMFVWTNGNIYFRSAETSGEIISPFASGMSTGIWYHWAVTRVGNLYTIYRNGTSVASATSTAIVNENKSFSVGRKMSGYVDDLRITRGYARYTANFIAPTSALITK